MATRIIDVDDKGNVRSVERTEIAEARQRLGQLAWLLDSSIPIPGTRLTVGLDALVGLLPFIGDLIGVLLSSYILAEASRLGAPRSVLMRMTANVGIEGVVGIVPFAGDIFDAAFKANQRNVKILNDWFDHPEKAERSSRTFGFFLISGVVLSLGLLIYLGFVLVRWLIGLF